MLYSRLGRTIEGAPKSFENASAAQWMQYLKGRQTFSPAERSSAASTGT
jgi:hypothetical protein